MQGKVRAGVAEETHSRIFQAPTVRPYAEARVLNMRNNDTGGKDYNIVTGAAYTYFAPTAPERTHRTLAHPAILATSKTVDR
jgi:hypothetical protein